MGVRSKHGEQGNKKVYVDEERFPLVRKMWDGLLTGNYTIPQITAKATDEWGLRTRRNKKLSLSTVYKLFTNPFYFGEFEYGGAVYQGKHQPMITPEEFDRVQKLLGLSGKPRPKTKRLPFTGIIRCNQCRCSITCEEKLKQIKTTGKTERYIYHRCTKRKRDVPCASKPITFTNLSGQVKGQLASVELHPDFLKWAIKVLRDRHELEQRDRNQILDNHQKNYQACVKRIDNLIDMYVSPENADRSMLTEAEYKERKAELLKEKAAIESEIRTVETRVTEWLELTEKTFHFATYAAINFAEADFETKTKMLRALGQNFVLDSGILRLDLKKPYLKIKNGLQEAPIDEAVLELVRNPTRQAVTATERVAAAKLSRWSS